jgi:hypothetical protein
MSLKFHRRRSSPSTASSSRKPPSCRRWKCCPGLTPEVLAENRAWMQKAGALDDTDVLILCFQSYVGEDAASHHPDRQLHRQTTSRGRSGRNGT